MYVLSLVSIRISSQKDFLFLSSCQGFVFVPLDIPLEPQAQDHEPSTIYDTLHHILLLYEDEMYFLNPGNSNPLCSDCFLSISMHIFLSLPPHFKT